MEDDSEMSLQVLSEASRKSKVSHQNKVSTQNQIPTIFEEAKSN